MTIELIPVIEIGYNNQGVEAPTKYPYWNNPEVWDAYHNQCYSKAGFKDKLIPYLKGSLFYRLSDISENNLTKLIIDHTEVMRDGKNEKACPFFGGYVLKVDGEDKFFPQCCGDLSDIRYWEELSDGVETYYEGHPTPVVRFDRKQITFDFDEHWEPFQPPPSEKMLIISKSELKIAVDKVKEYLLIFQRRLEQINETEKLSIENIGDLLIWNNLSI